MKKILCLVFLITSMSFSQEWHTNLEEAKTIAAENNKKVVLVFSGSDWCAPCMKLEREIWSSDTFKSHAKENYVMLKADFPKRKKNALTDSQQEHNNILAERYNKNGYFPLVVVLNKDGGLLGKVGYKKMKPKEYMDLLDSF